MLRPGIKGREVKMEKKERNEGVMGTWKVSRSAPVVAKTGQDVCEQAGLATMIVSVGSRPVQGWCCDTGWLRYGDRETHSDHCVAGF